MSFDFKNGCKKKFWIITKNHAADPEKDFSQNRFQSRMAARRPCRERES